MLRVIHNRLKAKAEELLTEEQAVIRPGRITVEHIFNSRVITEKHRQHQRDLFHSFIDFKRVFDRVWHAGLWQVLRSFNIEAFSTEKSKIMTNSTNNISADISTNDQKLEEVSRFKYLEVTLCKAAVCAFVMFTNCEG